MTAELPVPLALENVAALFGWSGNTTLVEHRLGLQAALLAARRQR